ncbi:NUDIX hydrolase [Candidatus Saccharibacteria bacterium]|nr:NUDIX hydrolase [Candidatus Saccharibacteria bacterium]
MNTKIFAVFGCLGKTTFTNKYPELSLDIESSPYEYIYNGDIRDIEKFKGTPNREKNPDFPHNYIKAIKQNIGKYPFIFIVQAKSVMRALDKEGIRYSVMYPTKSKVPQLLADAKARGNIDAYIQRLQQILATDSDLMTIKNTLDYDELIFLKHGEYVTTFLQAKYPQLFEKNSCVQPDFQSDFTYHRKKFYVDFYKLYGKPIPKKDWKQVYIVGKYNGRVPVVKYEKSRDNLPGGGIKFGEDIHTAIQRELREELNMEAITWEPLGYQRVYDESGGEFQLRVYAELRKIGDFVNDPDGHVIGYELVKIDELEEHIGYGSIGEYFQDVLKGKYGKRA